ncbi:MAG TPA: ATP-binding cassette domain-containing protein [Mycobacteriales bacterium]|nr:ATP-binding cassette domain-containing protein [Mycobacteriales bacterium]
MALLDVHDLVVEYISGDYVVRPLDGLNLAADDGELVLLLGPSGSGKTTLLSCLAGILTPTSGSITVAGRQVTALDAAALARYRRETVGVVFQGFNLIASLSARENVGVPLRLSGRRGRDIRSRADALLDSVGLGDRLGHRPGQLSGGQQQRVAIARALALNPPVLLADEPTAHLDHVQVEVVVGLLRRLAAPGRTVLVATHDDRMIPLADQVVEMAPKLTAEVVAPARVELKKGELVFAQGSRGTLVYVVESGRIEIVRELANGSEERLALVGPGEYFGELGPMLGLPRSATARAMQKSVLTSYSARDFRHRAGAGERERIKLIEPRTAASPRRERAASATK